MSFKNYVSLVQGFQFLPRQKVHKIHGKDFNVIPNPDLTATERLKVQELLARVTELMKEFFQHAVLMQMHQFPSPSVDSQQLDFSCWIVTDFLDGMRAASTILPQAFFEFQLTTQDSPSGNKVTKRLELAVQNVVQNFGSFYPFYILKEFVQRASNEYWRERPKFISLNASDWKNKNATLDISLGGTYTPEEIPIPTMKIDTASFLQNLFQNESSKDLTIVTGNGAEIKCHRIIFEGHSDVLAAMVNNGMKESKTGRISMTENSEDGMSRLIRYLYGMELTSTDMSSDIAVELFKTSHKYKLTGLLECLGKLLIIKQKDWFTPDDLLELYFHVKNLDDFNILRDHLLKLMLGMTQEIRSCERFNEIKRTDAADELLWKLLDLTIKTTNVETINTQFYLQESYDERQLSSSI